MSGNPDQLKAHRVEPEGCSPLLTSVLEARRAGRARLRHGVTVPTETPSDQPRGHLNNIHELHRTIRAMTRDKARLHLDVLSEPDKMEFMREYRERAVEEIREVIFGMYPDLRAQAVDTASSGQ